MCGQDHRPDKSLDKTKRIYFYNLHIFTLFQLVPINFLTFQLYLNLLPYNYFLFSFVFSF